MNHRAKGHPFIEWFSRYSNRIAYLGFAGVVALALFLNATNQRADQKARCEGGVDTRNVQRSLVEAVYNLASGAVQRDSNSPDLTKAEVDRYNTYLSRVNKFREDQYQMIKPTTVCVEYVTDDNIKPPTPPIPPLEYKKVDNP